MRSIPQVASRVARAMDRWRMYPTSAQQLMERALQRVAKSRKLSNDVTEIVTKALASPCLSKLVKGTLKSRFPARLRNCFLSVKEER